MIWTFAASESAPLAAEKLFSIGPLMITNSMVYGLLIGALVIGVLWTAAARSRVRPRSMLAYYVETVIEFLQGVIVDGFGGDKRRAMQHLPFLLSLFFFILAANFSGLLPGVGTITVQSGEHHTPLLRAFTTDLNGTLALAILTIGTVQYYALRELGLLGHLRHYFTDKPWLPMNAFIGVNEVFGELLRIVTLSMRLFGVIYAGEVLLHAIGALAGNFAWAATLPIMLLEIFFSLIQAYLFMMLTTVYLSIATSHEETTHSTAQPADGSAAVSKA